MNNLFSGRLGMLGLPLAGISTLLIAFVVLANLFVNRISELFAEIETASKTASTLQTKLNSLSSTQGQVSGYATSLITALPEKNSSLVALSQAKAIAGENALVLDNISVGSELKGDNLGHVDVVFDVEGPQPGVFKFIESLSASAPLGRFSRVKLTGNGSIVKANVAITSYWAELPTKIPAVSDPLADMTPEEQSLLTKVMNLRKPQFLELTPSLGIGRSNPFSQ